MYIDAIIETLPDNYHSLCHLRTRWCFWEDLRKL